MMRTTPSTDDDGGEIHLVSRSIARRAFFQAVRTALSKHAATEGKTDEELDHAVRQIVSRAVAPAGMLDIVAAAGLAKPDVTGRR